MQVEFRESGHSQYIWWQKSVYSVNSGDIIETSTILFHCKPSHAETNETYIKESATYSIENELYAHEHGVHYSGHKMNPMRLHNES